MSTFTNMTNGLEILLIIRVRTRMSVEEMTDGIWNFYLGTEYWQASFIVDY